MAWQDCIEEIRKAGGRNASDEEIHAIIEDVQLRAERMRRTRVDLSQAEILRAAGEEAAAEARMAARIEARNAKMNLLKRLRRHEFYESAPAVGKTPGIVMGLEAKLVGVNAPFAGSRLSVDAEARALKRDLIAGMTAEFDRAGLFETVKLGKFDREIARELFELNRDGGGNPGASGIPSAREAAAIIHKYQRAAVALLNKEGAWIGQYDGYIAKTMHDPDRIRRAGYAAWRATVAERLDDRTFDGMDTPEARETFLRRVHNALVTGVHLTAEGGVGMKDPAFTGPANLAKKRSAERVLHWRDADAWLDYQQAFGTGNLIENVVRSLDAAGRDTALMRAFGTNPRAEFEADLRRLAETWRDRDQDAVNKLTEARKMLTNRFDELDGKAATPVLKLAARIGAGVRAWHSMSKLGGVLLSSVADVPMKAAELNYQGIGLLQGYWDGVASLVRGRGVGETGEIIDLLRAGMEGMTGTVASRFDAHDPVPGRLAKMANLFFRYTGLSYWTDAQRAGAEFVMARHLGALADRAWDAVPDRTRRVLSMFDLGAAEWDAVRAVDLAQADGRAFLTPDAATRVTDEALEAIIPDRLSAIRAAALDRLDKAVSGLDALEQRLTRLDAELARAVPTMDDAERIGTAATMEGWRRSADTISRLREELRRQGRGERTPNQVHRSLVREIGALARAERTIGAEAQARLDRLLARIPKEEARHAEAAAAVARAKDAMVTRLHDIEEMPARLDAELAKARDGWRQDTALKLHAYFADRGEYAVINPGARERAILRQGTEAGTPAGEALRLIGQFKAFPVAVISKAWGRELYGGEVGWGRAAGIVHMMVASTVFGYLAMSLKDMAKGRTPRDPADPKAWAAAFVQGGGAGIYGDYIVGSYSRFGQSMVVSLSGPTGGLIDGGADLWNRVKAGDDVAASAFRFGLANTPFANLFYTRVGLDYLFLYQVQEALNPGFLRRFEDRVKRENGQSFLIRPSAAIPHGGGSRPFEGLR